MLASLKCVDLCEMSAVGRSLYGLLQTIVPHRKPPLDKTVENDEQIARSHLVDLELRYAGRTVDPVVRQDRICISAHNRLERKLNGKIEMVAEDGLDTLDHMATEQLESVRDVVVSQTEQNLNEQVGDAIDRE